MTELDLPAIAQEIRDGVSPSKLYQTRSGQAVTFTALMPSSQYPVKGYRKYTMRTWTRNGKYFLHVHEDPFDLVPITASPEIPQPKANAAPSYRISDEQVARDVAPAKHYQLPDKRFLLGGYPADLRDARAEITRLKNALDATNSQPEQDVPERLALAIHNARFAHPERPREPTPWDEFDREYAYRLARAVRPLLAALDGPRSVVTGDAERVRHVKRGSCYTVKYREGTLQTEQPLKGGDVLVTYVGEDGSVWHRPPHEFDDGRFSTLAPTPADRPQADVQVTDEVREALKDARENGLIYWQPVTSRGKVAKAQMLAHINTILTTTATPQRAAIVLSAEERAHLLDGIKELRSTLAQRRQHKVSFTAALSSAEIELLIRCADDVLACQPKGGA